MDPLGTARARLAGGLRRRLRPASRWPVRHALAALLIALGGLSVPAPGAAQDFGRVVSPILTLDREQLFAGTLYGQRVNRELEAASTAMAAETRAIEAALEAEEQALTEQRATMEAQAFRDLASAFDDKVQALRAEREAAEADLLAQIEAAQLAFFNRIGPVLGQLVRDRGAVLIVDRRAVLLAATNVDVTDAAIERIDAVLGDGGDLGGDPGGDPGPQQSPVTEAPLPMQDPGDETAVGVDTIPAPGTPVDVPGATPEE